MTVVDATLAPAWGDTPSRFRHTWEGIGNVDQFRWFVRRDLQEHLALAHQELGLRHVRAVGMFDDELKAFTKDPAQWRSQGDTLRTNWQVIDYCIGSLLDLGIAPMFTTSFMPSAFASGTTTCFSTRAHTSPPKDYDAWARFVREAVEHQVRMWGRDVVRGWYFEVWNEPNLMGCFWGGDAEQWLRLWSTTWRAIKSVDEGFRVGGPSTARAEWLPELLAHAAKDGTPPDYLITHIYNNDSDAKPLSPFDGAQEDRINQSPNFLAAVVRGSRKLLDQAGFRGEIHWNEWGRSWFPSDPPRETPLEAAFVCRAMAEVAQQADYFGYWCLSDIYDQAGYGATPFHGNYGMLNLQGLRKPVWHAFQLLGRLGAARVPVRGGDGWTDAIATTDGGDRALVYRHPRAFGEAPTTGRVAVALRGEPKACRLWRVDRRENNVLTRWRELGAPDHLDRRALADLRAGNALQPSPMAPTVIRGTDGVWRAEFDLECPAVALLELG